MYNKCFWSTGKPPMTSTATLRIHVQDKNDNVPFLPNGMFDMCQSDGVSKANITVVDLDEEPYSGPFRFKLLGDVEGKWSIEPLQGEFKRSQDHIMCANNITAVKSTSNSSL